MHLKRHQNIHTPVFNAKIKIINSSVVLNALPTIKGRIFTNAKNAIKLNVQETDAVKQIQKNVTTIV